VKPEDDFTSWRYVIRESVGGFLMAMGIVVMVIGGLMMTLAWVYG